MFESEVSLFLRSANNSACGHRDDRKRFVVPADEKLTASWNWNRQNAQRTVEGVNKIRQLSRIE
ncbi:MAG: hypothetical protein DMF05_12750 [Verrucomicrobia bacterium]|nr:MAG: hypothetical protein DMF05_12750 [Verrucomicrobiota bacterium]